MQRMMKAAVLAATLALSGCATSDWAQVEQVLGSTVSGMGATPLAEAEIMRGLREALAQGTEQAIRQLGRSDGFWAHADVRIPLPEALARGEPTLRKLGGGRSLDEFQLTLNRAAEQAVPQVAQIFGDALRQMTIEDARGILHGPDDAATAFFRRHSREALHARIYPIVQATTQRVGVTQQYKRLVSGYGPLLQMAGVKVSDLDGYVTDEALEGLFLRIAQEEMRIRRDPAARTSEILRRVFGAR